MSGSASSWLTNSDGTRIRIERLGGVILGIIAGTFGSGAAKVVASVMDAWLIRPLEAGVSFLGDLIDAILSGPEYLFRLSWWEAEAALDWTGPFAFAFALALVIIVAYITVRGRGLSGL